MKQIFTYLLALFFFQISLSQQSKIDSLKIQLSNETTDKSRLKTLKQICEVSVDILDISQSENYFEELNNLSKKLKDIDTQSYTHQLLAEMYKKNRDFDNAKKSIYKSIKINKRRKNDSALAKDYSLNGTINNHFQKFDSAIVYYNKALKICNEKEYLKLKGYILNNYASTLYNQNKNIEALELNHKALDIAENNNFDEIKLFALRGLGVQSMNIGDYSKAEEYLLKALNTNNTGNKSLECEIMRYLGLNYSRSSNFKKAVQFNENALECFESKGHKMFVLDVLINQSGTFLRQNKYAEALPYLLKALELSKEINSKFGANVSKINLSSCYINLGQLNKAELMLKEMLKDTLNVDVFNKNLEKVAYQNLSELYETKKDYKNAFVYHRRFKFLEDSLVVENKTKEISEIDTKYQTEKKERELAEQNEIIKTQELENQKANTRNWFLAFGLFAVAVSAFFIWRRYKSEAKAKQTISGQKDVIEELQKELHHRVKNNLNIIDAFVDEIKDDYEDSELEDKLEELQNRIASINEVHTQLYQSTDVTSVDLKKYIESLANNVASTYHNKNVSVNQQIEEDLKLQADKSSVLGLIINEFLTNSYKYAFDDEGEIKVNINETEEDYVLKLSDNGKGLPKDFDINMVGSYGLRIMKLLSRQLKGTFDIKNNNGVELNIQFPKA